MDLPVLDLSHESILYLVTFCVCFFPVAKQQGHRVGTGIRMLFLLWLSRIPTYGRPTAVRRVLVDRLWMVLLPQASVEARAWLLGVHGAVGLLGQV